MYAPQPIRIELGGRAARALAHPKPISYSTHLTRLYAVQSTIQGYLLNGTRTFVATTRELAERVTTSRFNAVDVDHLGYRKKSGRL
jgi:hypothetical protein